MYRYVLHRSLFVCIVRSDINIARMGRRMSRTNCFLKIQGKRMSGKLSAEIMKMRLIVRKVCGGMDYIKLGQKSAQYSAFNACTFIACVKVIKFSNTFGV
jgi:hypothetical protein